MLPCSDLLGLSLSLLAIIILRVSALYDKTKWVGRCLWILSGLLYIITITFAALIMKSSYGECIFAGIVETLSNESAEKFAYEPSSRVCLPVDVTGPSYAVFALPLIFDVVIIILTAFKIFRLASGLRRLSGNEIVRNLPSLILCALLSAVLASSTQYSRMGFCTYRCERTSAMPLTVNRPPATLSPLFVYQIGLSPFPADLTRNIIGRSPYMECRYLDSPPQLLYVSGDLPILGYTFYVLCCISFVWY